MVPFFVFLFERLLIWMYPETAPGYGGSDAWISYSFFSLFSSSFIFFFGRFMGLDGVMAWVESKTYASVGVALILIDLCFIHSSWPSHAWKAGECRGIPNEWFIYGVFFFFFFSFLGHVLFSDNTSWEVVRFPRTLPFFLPLQWMSVDSSACT